jgi:RNA polymerase sigma-70 factor (TIGR02943 family)
MNSLLPIPFLSSSPAKADPAPVHTLDPESWIENHRAYLTNIALGRLRDPSLAEDLVQETFLAAWRARAKFGGRASERTWLTRILLNKIADHYRSDARKPIVSVSELGSEQTNEEVLDSLFLARGGSMETSRHEPASAAERAEFVHLVEKMLDEVPAQAAAAFRMRELQGFSTDDIVRRLNITPNHLWVLIHRAKKALRKKMEEVWERTDRTESAFSAPLCC